MACFISGNGNLGYLQTLRNAKILYRLDKLQRPVRICCLEARLTAERYLGRTSFEQSRL